jgi:putative phosphoesterase
MRILVLADIHANWPALTAIREPFDACFVLGDIVDYGGSPSECVDWVRKNATAAIRGNHDHAVAQRVMARGGIAFKGWAAATRPLQWDSLDQRQLKFLARLPVTQRLTLGQTRFLLVHGTPRDPMDEYLVSDAMAWKRRLTGIEADVVCVGHTHIQFMIEVDGVRVLNPGSVGQPRDGDPRAAYAVITDGEIELKRVEYDIDAAVAVLARAGLEPGVLEFAEQSLRRGTRPPPNEFLKTVPSADAVRMDATPHDPATRNPFDDDSAD